MNCPHGHPLTGPNLKPSDSARGKNGCVTCNRAHGHAQATYIRAAVDLVGVTRREYRAAYGSSKAGADRVLGPGEALRIYTQARRDYLASQVTE